jgi:hypothetical protein
VVENGEGGEGGHYYANKGILTKSGSYFEALFSPENQHFVENQTGRIVVKDTTNSAMEALVWYLYGDPIKITVSNVVNVLELADRWSINNLCNYCIWFIQSSICESNVIDFLKWASYTLHKDTLHKDKYEDLLLFIRTYFKKNCLSLWETQTDEMKTLSTEHIEIYSSTTK